MALLHTRAERLTAAGMPGRALGLWTRSQQVVVQRGLVQRHRTAGEHHRTECLLFK